MALRKLKGLIESRTDSRPGHAISKASYYGFYCVNVPLPLDALPVLATTNAQRQRSC